MTLTHTPAHTVSHPDRFEDEETGLGYRVLQDTCAEDPRDELLTENMALWAHREPSLHRSVAATKPKGNIAIDAFAHFHESFEDDERALTATRRWLRIFHPQEQIEVDTATIRGYSQSDWLDVVCAVAEGYGPPADHIDQFRMWAFGDVWVVRPDSGYITANIYADTAEEAVDHYRREYEQAAQAATGETSP